MDLTKLFQRKKVNKRIKRDSELVYQSKLKTFYVTDSGPKRSGLPLDIFRFKKITSRVILINAENVKWRVGFRLVNEVNPSVEYVFHVYQDPGSEAFHSRILEMRSSKDVSPDIKQSHIGVANSKNFVLTLEKIANDMYFYVDRNFLGKYSVSLHKTTNLLISAWSHGNATPITVSFMNLKVWGELSSKGQGMSEMTREKTKSYEGLWSKKWWIEHWIFPLAVVLVGGLLLYLLGLNAPKNNDIHVQTSPSEITPPVLDTISQISIRPTSAINESKTNSQSIKIGNSYIDPKSQVVIGVHDISVSRQADISITVPGKETVNHNEVVPGKVFYFDNEGVRYSLLIKSIDFVWDSVDIQINALR